MGGIATILIAGGIVALIWAAVQKFKSGRLSKAPFAKTGEVASKGNAVAGERGAVSVEGEVKCPAPLISPVSGTPCLYYELKVVGSWKEGDEEKSKDYVDEKMAAGFGLDDGSGIVPVDLRGGGDLEPFEKTFEETKKEGFFADLKSAVGKKEPMMFGKYAFDNPAMSKANKFTCTERVFKVQPRLYVLGKHESGVITKPGFMSLLATHKSRDQLMGSTAKAAKNFGIGGGASVAVGLVLAVIASFMAPDPADVAPEAPVAASANAPAASELDEGTVRPAAAEGEGTTAIAVGGSGAGGTTATCEQATRCCEVLSGAGAAACASLRGASDAACKTSLTSFKKAVKSSKPKRLKECN